MQFEEAASRAGRPLNWDSLRRRIDLASVSVYKGDSPRDALVVELVDTLVLGTSGASRNSSSLFEGTISFLAPLSPSMGLPVASEKLQAPHFERRSFLDRPSLSLREFLAEFRR
jgi:hypothetical protein